MWLLTVAAATAHAVVAPCPAAHDQRGSVELVVPRVGVRGHIRSSGIDLNIARRRAFRRRGADALVAANAGALGQGRIVWIGRCDGRGHDRRRDAGRCKNRCHIAQGRPHRHVLRFDQSSNDQPDLWPAYSPFPVISGKSSVVLMPGEAATTAGMALTTLAAVATRPAWL